MKVTILILLTLLSTSQLQAQEEVSGQVIVNPRVTEALDPEVIRKIYLGKVTESAVSNYVPLLENNEQIKQRFVRDVLRKTPSQYGAYWAKRLFTGKGVPPAELEAAEIYQQVETRQDHIGAVTKDAMPSGSKARPLLDF